MKRNLVRAFIASGAVILGLGGMSALAATDTDRLAVRLQIVDGCTVNFDRGTRIELGKYANIRESIEYPSSFSVRCTASDGTTAGQSYSVELDAGMSPATPNDPHTRRLIGVATRRFVDYQIYRGNIVGGAIWGNAEDDKIKGNRAVNGVETANRHEFVIHVPVQDTPTPDEYVDQVTATVTYTASN